MTLLMGIQKTDVKPLVSGKKAKTSDWSSTGYHELEGYDKWICWSTKGIGPVVCTIREAYENGGGATRTQGKK